MKDKDIIDRMKSSRLLTVLYDSVKVNKTAIEATGDFIKEIRDIELSGIEPTPYKGLDKEDDIYTPVDVVETEKYFVFKRMKTL